MLRTVQRCTHQQVTVVTSKNSIEMYTSARNNAKNSTEMNTSASNSAKNSTEMYTSASNNAKNSTEMYRHRDVYTNK